MSAGTEREVGQLRVLSPAGGWQGQGHGCNTLDLPSPRGPRYVAFEQLYRG